MTHKQNDKPKRRNLMTFEPCGPILRIFTLELNNRTRGRQNARGEKIRLFEDTVAKAFGEKYPKLVEEFNILRKEAMS
jgi:hypothetical protein